VRRLISFDIDGTLEVGDPPGVISLAVVRRALDLGFVVGSCSDRPLSFQRALWHHHAIPVNFTLLKQHLSHAKEFAADQYLHIGDSFIDQTMAKQAGFDFLHSVEDDVHAFLRRLRLLG